VPHIDGLRGRLDKIAATVNEMPRGLDAQEKWWRSLTDAERAACELPGAGLFRWLDEQIAKEDARGLVVAPVEAVPVQAEPEAE